MFRYFIAACIFLASANQALVLEKPNRMLTDGHRPSVVEASCSDYPDGTKTKLFFSNCSPDKKLPIQAKFITVEDPSGQVDYPINLKKPLVIVATSQNSGPSCAKVVADVQIAEYYGSKGNWLGQHKCSFYTINTFGLLNNLDGCSIGHNCPLKQGQITLKQEVDLAKYSSIIKVLTSSLPYRLIINLSCTDSGSKAPIACFNVESLI